MNFTQESSSRFSEIESSLTYIRHIRYDTISFCSSISSFDESSMYSPMNFSKDSSSISMSSDLNSRGFQPSINSPQKELIVTLISWQLTRTGVSAALLVLSVIRLLISSTMLSTIVSLSKGAQLSEIWFSFRKTANISENLSEWRTMVSILSVNTNAMLSLEISAVATTLLPSKFLEHTSQIPFFIS